jgi:arylsulfatase A-like enzyme
MHHGGLETAASCLMISSMIWKTHRFLLAAILCAETVAADSSKSDQPASRPAAGQRSVQRHIVVVVWDGMRPDFVTKQNTPTLWELGNRGVIFRNHHAVYPSATNVNGTAMGTGVYPSHSGIVANHEFRPAINSRNVIDTSDLNAAGKGDQVLGNKYIAVPTVAELVRQSGGRTVIASAKTIGLLLDRQIDKESASPLGEGRQNSNSHEYAPAKDCVTLFAGNALPYDALVPLTAALGRFPRQHLQQDAWTTRAAVDLFWKEDVPTFSVLWLGEPDLTQHETAPGAPAALAAIKSSDENLGQVLAGLKQHHAIETTDIFVVSDHGFSTIERAVDLQKILRNAGFDAVTQFAHEPGTGQIMMVGNGGSVLFYVIGHQPELIHRLVKFLQQSDFAGVIFTRDTTEGTFGFDVAKINPPSISYGAASGGSAPDVEMSFQWSDKKSQFGIPGMIDADWQREAGKGTHATLSRFDMHNILIAAGPDFRSGDTDDLPSGNIDLAPTILKVLGIATPSAMDGRVLSEAMTGNDRENPKSETNTIEATKKFTTGSWRQTLKISRVGSAIYLDEGNGKFTP